MSARRQMLRVIAASVLAAPFSSRAQQQAARIHRIGYLSPLTPAADSTRSEAFRLGLQELGTSKVATFSSNGDSARAGSIGSLRSRRSSCDSKSRSSWQPEVR